MIVSQTLHPKCGPNSLSMVINGLTNSQQVEFAVEHFSWDEMVLFEFFPMVPVFIGINSLSKQQSELFVQMIDYEIIKDWIDH